MYSENGRDANYPFKVTLKTSMVELKANTKMPGNEGICVWFPKSLIHAMQQNIPLSIPQPRMFCGKRKTNGRIEGGGKMPPELSQTTRHFQNRFSLGPKTLGNVGIINKSKVDRNCAQSWIFKLFIFHGSFLPHLVIAHVVSAAIKSGLYCRDHHKGHHKILYIALAVDAIYGWCVFMTCATMY